MFRWKEELASLTHVNRSVIQILNLQLTYVFLVMAFVLFAFQPELTMTRLGQALLIAFSVFWFMRAVEQVVFFGLKHKASNALTVLFFIGGVLHLLPVF
jgi:ABC-type bacteriocin/lantibiotic exporter with double-glycine peptidase domain